MTTGRRRALLDNGMTPRQAVVHKLRGLADVAMSLESLYPKTFSVTAVLLMLAIAFGTYRHFFKQTRELALRGMELDSANATYSLIQAAEGVSEEIESPEVQRMALAKADIEYAKMAATAHTDLGHRATRVFGAYLDYVHRISMVDLQCAEEFRQAVVVQTDPEASDLQRSAKATSYFGCQASRSVIRNGMSACRQESFTLVTGTNEPPLSSCIFRHESPSAMQR